MKSAQVGLIGAMQRAHPALTQLFLRWTGIPGLEQAEFRVSRSEEQGPPDTTIWLAPKAGVQEGWSALCDAMRLPPEAEERRSMPIRLTATSTAHGEFWEYLRHREMSEVDGPLEWWWRLLVLRNRDIKRASRKLTTSVFGEDPLFDNCVVSFDNESLSKEGRRAEELLVSKTYSRPTRFVITRSVGSKAKREGLAFHLDNDTLRAHVTAQLVALATTRMS